MHQNIAAQAEQKKDEREKVLKEIRQLENRQKLLENKQRNEERKARTRRLLSAEPFWRVCFLWFPTCPAGKSKRFL